MVKIESKANVIPVEIGELKYEVRITDKMLLEMEKTQVVLSKKYKETRSEKNDSLEEVVNSLNDTLKKMFNVILGEGAYTELYEQTPSVFELFHILQQLIEVINKEADKIKKGKKNKAKEYLGE